MKFIHRLAYFLIGLTVGSIFVYFIWNKKDVHFDYLPNARVLKDISNDIRIYEPKALEEMTAIGIDTADVSAIISFGDVDFKNSEPRREPCKKYIVLGEPRERLVTLTISKCDSISTIQSVILSKE